MPLICLLTIHSEKSSFLDMFYIVKADSGLYDILIRQTTTWLDGNINLNTIIDIYKIYMSSDRDITEIIDTVKGLFRDNIYNTKELSLIIDKYLIPHEMERKQNAEISTPKTIREEMLDTIPSEFWEGGVDFNTGKIKASTVLEPCCGKGGFVIDIVDRYMTGLEFFISDEKQRYKFIVENCIYFADINPTNIFICKLLVDPENQYKLNYYIGDTLKLCLESQFNLTNMDAVIGNPPYNEELKSTGAKPLYNKFVEYYMEKCDLLCFIIPSRWFSGGKGLDSFRKNMLDRTDIVYIKHFDDATKIFGNSVDIKGGVNYFLKDRKHNGDCMYNGFITKLNKYDVFIDGKFHPLIDKLVKFDSVITLYLGRYFGIESNDKRLKNEKTKDTIKCYVSQQKGFEKNIEKKEIKKEYNFWKVITAEAAHEHKSGFGNSFIGKPDEIHTGSYISFKVSNEEEAKSLISYIKCRLPNFMLSLRKMSQHSNESTCKWIPLPPLNKEWTDEEVYKHFKLSEDDIKLINDTNIIGYKLNH